MLTSPTWYELAFDVIQTDGVMVEGPDREGHLIQSQIDLVLNSLE